MPHGAIPYPFGDCQVCSDKATGVHYGVATCEGCKVHLANHLYTWLFAIQSVVFLYAYAATVTAITTLSFYRTTNVQRMCIAR